MNFDVIFVAGVHGVGKCYLINLLKENFHIWSLSASEIIKHEKQKKIDSCKLVLDADDNQDHLIKGLNDLDIKQETLILDGHFCLQNSTGRYNVPLSTFNNINIKTIFLLTEEVDVIHKRLLTRDGKSLNKEIIFNLQEDEKIRAEYIADKLNVSITHGTSSEIDAFLNYFRKKNGSSHLTNNTFHKTINLSTKL